MKDEALSIFNELLEEWYWSEHAVINEYSSNMSKEYDELEERKKRFQERFINALRGE